ncbi:unnamed protein product [Malus baccata var. baccata]
MPEPPPPPPSLPPKELQINRYKFIWRVLMISNLALGGYMFIGGKKRDRGDRGTLNPKSVETGAENHKPAVEVPSVPATTPTTTPATTTTTSETWDM